MERRAMARTGKLLSALVFGVAACGAPPPAPISKPAPVPASPVSLRVVNTHRTGTQAATGGTSTRPIPTPTPSPGAWDGALKALRQLSSYRITAVMDDMALVGGKT